MNTKLLYGLAVLLLFSVAGCQDLTVENENNPNRELALAEPGDVENLVANTFTDYWSANQWSARSMPWSTIADEISSSWANWGMRDMSSEPRIAWNNDPAYNRGEMTEDPWFDSYTGISNAIDGILAIEGNEAKFEQAGIDPNRLRAFAKFNMGLLHGTLAMRYDQGFIVDETVDLEAVALGQEELNLQPYNEVMEAAIGFLDEAISIAQSNSFTITADEDWIFGLDVTSGDLVRLANSFAARFMANVGRNPQERAAADWNEIIRRADAGITEDFAPIGDDNGNVREWDALKFYGQEETTWARADYRTLGPADESGGYQDWMNTPVAERNVFHLYSSDRRITGPDSLTQDGKYFRYVGVPGPWPSARGTYHYASHTHKRFVDYLDANANGEMMHMVKAEMDLYKAEGLLRTGGSAQTAADLINNTRVTNGELEPATAGDAVGDPVADGGPNDTGIHLASASLWAKLKHEFRIETFATAGALAWAYDRGFNDLVSGTPIHYPVPGRELETLALDNYTFGGVGGPGAAPKRSGSEAWPDKGTKTR